jgi:predicted transcriptional regulator
MDESPIMGHRKQGKVLYSMTNLDLKNVDKPSKSGGVLTAFDTLVR